MKLRSDHKAVRGCRTIHLGRLRDPRSERVLKGARGNSKVGGRVLRGPWRGMPIYALSLEERRTCDRGGCEHWLDCYGNNMRFAHRMAHGVSLMAALRREVRELASRHPGGFVIRLHILGDFYSEPYVGLWAELLERYGALHVFGYTARRRSTRIGKALLGLRELQPKRFRVRWSGDAGDELPALSEHHPAAQGGMICPAQSKGGTCAQYGICCAFARKAVVFLSH